MVGLQYRFNNPYMRRTPQRKAGAYMLTRRWSVIGWAGGVLGQAMSRIRAFKSIQDVAIQTTCQVGIPRGDG